MATILGILKSDPSVIVCVEVFCKLTSVATDWASCAVVNSSQMQLQLNRGLLRQFIANRTKTVKYRAEIKKLNKFSGANYINVW